MKRTAIFILACLASACSDGPEDFPIEIRCAEEAYNSAGRMSAEFGKPMFIARTIIWLRKSENLPLNAVKVPESAKAEMYRLQAISRAPEGPLPCTLSDAEEDIAGGMLVTLASAGEGRELRADQMLDALTE